ncbi:MAG: antibiotic biosynthesis monooxygenase [Methanomassiliicoccus sp.]|nr:antibiotic biosynthesis monooxygenase [Methanomassiliicoccus sp.]
MGDDGLFSMAIWDVKRGMEDEFVEAWTSFAKWTSKNRPGALGVWLLKDRSFPQRYITFGPWKDLESLKAWRETDEFDSFLDKARKMCTDIRPMTLDKVMSLGGIRVTSER